MERAVTIPGEWPEEQDRQAMPPKRRLAPDRRGGFRRDEDVARRLTDLEETVRANRRELELQFRRMAHMQAEIDKLKKRDT